MTDQIPLGKASSYPDQYSPGLLHAIARTDSREALGLGTALPFDGCDIWNAWELTWLNPAGIPQVAAATLQVPASSPNIVESKSLKLYLNSFAMTKLDSANEISTNIEKDLSTCTGTDVSVALRHPTDEFTLEHAPGDCIDVLDVRCDEFEVDSGLLSSAGDVVDETLHSHLLRSLCPVTNQPDVGSVLIRYRGPRIEREGLLHYIVSYRQHSDFHEACVERIFVDLLERCEPEKLSVYAAYQRRGGIDINPFRSNIGVGAPNLRLWRQ